MVIHPLHKSVAAADIPPEKLAGNTLLTEDQKIAEASRQFEAILLRQILAASQKTVISSKLTDNSTASEIYRDMITSQLADSISKSGAFGLAQTFEQQLRRPTGRGETKAPSGAHPAEGTLPNPAFSHGAGISAQQHVGVFVTHATSNHTHE